MRRLLFAAFLLLAPAAHANVLWRGDFSTGDLSQWTSPQSAAPPGHSWDPSRLSVVTTQHPPDDPHALQITLNAGDVAWNTNHNPPIYMGSRSEVTHPSPLGEGAERWYYWEVYFPANYGVNDGKGGGAVFTQWHHTSPTKGEPGSPPLLFSAFTNVVQLVHVPRLNSTAAEVMWQAPLVKNQWHEFMVHIKFSSNPQLGLVEISYDHQTVLSRPMNTLFPGFTDYLKMGQYRRPNATPNDTIWISNVVEGTTEPDVAH
jgi:hypothetical protein